MGVGGHVAQHEEILNAVDGFLFARLHGGAGQETAASRYVFEADVVVFGMKISFHGKIVRVELTLARFETRVGFVNDVDTTPAAHHLAIRVARFEGFDGRDDFHGVLGFKE